MKEKINKSGEKAFFAAANSGLGFYSFYGEVFGNGEIARRYIIKGGPGTGKSRFMRESADHARSCGYPVEYYYCSSDPTSLDGIIIDHPTKGRTCIIDGTAPHDCDADIPGARDEIIDLGAFWDPHKLSELRGEIERLMRKKSIAYKKASEALRAVFELTRTAKEEAYASIKKEKLDNASQRILRGVDASDVYFERIGLRSSFGMFGECTLDTYTSVCDDIIIIDDSLSLAHAYLESILSHLRRFSISSYRSYSSIDPEKLDAVYIPSMSLSLISDVSGICVSLEKCRKRINMQKFVESESLKEIKYDVRSCEKAIKELKARGESEMERMREAHFELERIYIDAMDFSAKEEFSEKWIEENL